jgi:hypothetical protein
MTVRDKWLRLAAEFLEKAADKFSSHGCNDWEFPANWDDAEKRGFIKAIHEDNGDPENFDPDNLHIPDWLAMSFLASWLGAKTRFGGALDFDVPKRVR